VAFHSGERQQARQRLQSAQARWQKLQVCVGGGSGLCAACSMLRALLCVMPDRPLAQLDLTATLGHPVNAGIRTERHHTPHF
jgi:hypothetical protein